MGGYIDPDWLADETEDDGREESRLFMQCMILIGQPPAHTPRVPGDGPGRAALAQHDRCRSCMLDLERPWKAPDDPPPACCEAGCDVFEFVATTWDAQPEEAREGLADPCAHCPARGRWNPVKRAFEEPTCSGSCSVRYREAHGAACAETS